MRIHLPRNIDLWLLPYLRQMLGRVFAGRRREGPVHLMFALVDHYEPAWRTDSVSVEEQRVRRWSEDYPRMAAEFRDVDGVMPQHSFFFPAEEYRRQHLDALGALCDSGHGEVEIHLHHDNDTEDGVREKIVDFRELLHEEHGMLGRSSRSGRVEYGFIHGNWALNNSRPDGRWCGVNNESEILLETGCYGDFTLPSAPSDTQSRQINSIYYGGSCREAPKGHNTGPLVQAGGVRRDELLMVQGPLLLNWRDRSRAILPRVENAEVDFYNQPSANRARLWMSANVHVAGRPDWVYIKLHTHGAVEDNAKVLLGEPVRRMHRLLQEQFNDGERFRLHYVTAREMVNLIRATEAGAEGEPAELRDFEIAPPQRSRHTAGD